MTNYNKGRRKEFKVRLQLLDDGYDIAQRSAGSHSPIDIFAISRDKRIIKLVQCKPKSMSDNAKQKIVYELNWLNGVWRVEFEVV